MCIQKMRRFLFCCLLFDGCATHHEAHWRRYDAGAFTFSLTSEFHKTPAHGIDSYVSEFENERMIVGFDYGSYSGKPLDDFREDQNSLLPHPSFISHMETIDRHQVQIVSVDIDRDKQFPHVMAASFLNSGLTMSARCKTTDGYEDATRIFRSVRFKPH